MLHSLAAPRRAHFVLALALLGLLLWFSTYSTSAQVGQQITLDGWLMVLHGDPPPGTRPSPEPLYLLLDDQGDTTRLLLDGRQAVVLANQRVQIIGLPTSGRAARQARGGPSAAVQVLAIRPIASSAPRVAIVAPSGPQPWVTVLCRFADSPDVTPHTPAWYEGMMGNEFPGMDHYFRQISNGSISLAGSTVVGWFDLPQAMTYYASGGEVNWGALADDCTAAAESVIDYSLFVGINMFFNQNYDGPAGGHDRWPLTRDGQARTFGLTWLPTWATQQVVAHEMSHGFGIPHSNIPGAVAGNMWDGDGNCSPPHPIYGCIASARIAYHLDHAGWVPSGRKAVVAPGKRLTLPIDRLVLPSSDSSLLVAQVQVSDSRFYSIEARRSAGYDAYLPGEAVIINDVDTTRWGASDPAQPMDSDGNKNPNDAGTMWTVGETFTDAANGVSIAVTGADATSFTVTIMNQACPVGQYRAEYFNNKTLSGTPVFVRCEAAPTNFNPGTVNYNWGTNRPDPRINPDNFSIRWTGDFDVAAGDYTFFARTDDGMRVYVDDALVINQWRDQAATLYQAARTMAGGERRVKIEYYAAGGSAQAQVWWAPVCPTEQYRAEYFNNKELAGAPLFTRCETTANIHHDLDWGTSGPDPRITPDNFSVRWTGRFSFKGAAASNSYTFYARTNDGMRVFIDGTRIINAWGNRTTAAPFSAARTLSNGTHEVRVEYYENTGAASAQVWWEPKPTCGGLGLTYEQTQAGTLSNSRFEQVHCFFGQAGDWVSLRMFAVNNSGLDTYIKLYAPNNGPIIGQDDDGAWAGSRDSFVTVQLPQTGLYKLVATRYEFASGTTAGDYRIRLERGREAAVGDVNRSCTVDDVDYTQLVSDSGKAAQNSDLDLNGIVEQRDRDILLANYGHPCASAATAGPATDLPKR
jgi:hypothetical protein